MVSAIQAWTILKSQALGESDGTAAVEALTQPEQEQLHSLFIGFMNKATNLLESIEAEAEKLLGATNLTPDARKWTITEVYQYLAAIKGSRYEQFHVTALLQVRNTDLIWDEMKPEVAAA